ncbi:NmrA-like family domain-containing protein 1 [Lasiodiplodia theobromae]|uniref:NmrA-like family domain-containing protein 1 n=1 Tax=Lasiodiplodia theobromae TaxID=45133 RepID=A0A5N5DB07_9PEZI|nr:NmrA-like family domain-containing protein 1 [Lasiodiplodia theobromae]
MSKLLVIVGITGNQGGSVADAFINDSNWRIRAITRDTSKGSAQEWAARGVELVRADQDDVASLTAAFTGAHAIFAMTDYWAPLGDPAVRSAAARRGVSANQQCAELETQRGTNMALAAAAPEVQRTLERFVYSSLPDSSRLSGGKYTQVWHFDSKAAVERFVREDRAMAASGLSAKASFIHVGLYTDNWRRAPTTEICRDPATGGYWHLDFSDGSRKSPFVWTRRDTGPLVRKLIEDVQPGARLMAASQVCTYREFMAIWARTLGQKLAGDGGIKVVSPQEFRDLIQADDDLKDHLAECWFYLRDFGYDGGDTDTLYPKDIGAESLMSTLEEYFKSEDWSALLP